MASQKHVDLLKQGVEQWNRWREQQQELRPDLSLANLREMDLSHANLFQANLSEANLIDANLFQANLGEAVLINAILIGTTLSEADLSGANLSGARLRSADLSRTNLQGASTSYTVFSDMDLRSTKGLLEILHAGPSPVALYNVQLPQDGTALHFLRNAGVPDEWIDFYRSTMMMPIQYCSCFISYTSQDRLLAQRLHADLQDHGVRCWFAPENLKIGDKIRSRVDEAIHLQDKLLLLLSEHSIASSRVENEVETALEREEHQQRDALFPICLDDVVMQTSQAWAATLRRTRHIGDFTNWTQQEAYQQAFERLLRDLKKANGQQDEESKR